MIKTYTDYCKAGYNSKSINSDQLREINENVQFPLLFNAEEFITYLYELLNSPGCKDAFVANMRNLNQADMSFYHWFDLWAAWNEFTDYEMCEAVYL